MSGAAVSADGVTDPYAEEFRALAKGTAKVHILVGCRNLLGRLPEALIEPGQTPIEKAATLREVLLEVVELAYPRACAGDPDAGDVMAGGALLGLVSEKRGGRLPPSRMGPLDEGKQARQLVAADWFRSARVSSERRMQPQEGVALDALRLALFAFLRDGQAVRRFAQARGISASPSSAQRIDPPAIEDTPSKPEPLKPEPLKPERPKPEPPERTAPPPNDERGSDEGRRTGRKTAVRLATASILGVGAVAAVVAVLWPTHPTGQSGKIVTVWNMVTNGATGMRPDRPAYLSTQPRIMCKARGCVVPGTDMDTGNHLTALCQTQGERTTNGEDGDSVDDHNPGLRTSTIWYRAKGPHGRVGYISDVWLQPSERGGDGLPTCTSPQP